MITHVIKTKPNKNGWIEVPFISIEDNQTLICNHVPFMDDSRKELNEEEIKTLIEEQEIKGNYKKLTLPIDLKQNEAVFIAPNGRYFISNKDNPFDDPNPLLFCQ